MTEFADRLLHWFDVHGRHDLPWQQNITPYRVWVSEIMLQQTQVKTVIPYYLRFMARFPSLKMLASATQEEVLAHWSGLGYYARGRNLHKAALQIMTDFDGKFPSHYDEIVSLPGIGRSTAGAILSISLNQQYPILDGNVKRVLSRFYALEGWPGEKQHEQWLWLQADQLTPAQRFNDYTQAIMDLGATVCTRSKPRCEACPMATSCQANQQQRVGEFPYSKPKKVLPVKQRHFLMLENQLGQLWLQQRPDRGIWGGLWSFPEFEDEDSCLQQVKSLQSSAQTMVSLVEWQTFRHTFSHYHLDITPIHVRGLEDAKQSQQGQWVCRQQIAANDKAVIAVPAPVVKLVKEMEKQYG